MNSTPEDTAEEYHPPLDLLERFMSGKLDAAACRVIVRHLLTGCPVCRAVTGRLWSPGTPGTILRQGRPRPEKLEEERSLAVVD